MRKLLTLIAVLSFTSAASDAKLGLEGTIWKLKRQSLN